MRIDDALAAARVVVRSVRPARAPAHFGWRAGFLATDSPASSARTRELMKWQAAHAGLIDDLKSGHYFDRPAAEEY